ncbi:Hypp6057 [Branchiostoma lanceolatum]|uniref:Hypp6057 protein n=1 Tax=Branchiostoma lanceolatum TaxID=7740 RepID=A0A8J9YRR4_BRALA|nr:Hypp6057 [Branchiostoma lanceolatum]
MIREKEGGTSRRNPQLWGKLELMAPPSLPAQLLLSGPFVFRAGFCILLMLLQGQLPGQQLAQGSCPAGTSGQLPGQQLAQGSCPAGTSGQLPGRNLRAVARLVAQGSCPAGTSGQLPGRYLRAVARPVAQGSCPAGTSGQLPGW